MTGDYTNDSGTEIGLTLEQSREKANNATPGGCTEEKQGFTTSFYDPQGNKVGEHYSRTED